MSDVYLQITESIVAALEAGTIPWRKPWTCAGFVPCNYISKRSYHGLNSLLLAMQPYESPFWLTFRQARSLGGYVRKGEHGCRILFWKAIRIDEDQDGQTPAAHVNADPDNASTPKFVPYLQSWTVFNVAQCEGIGDIPTMIRHDDFTPIDAAQEIVAAMPQRPAIFHHEGSDRAVYSPIRDEIHMPMRAQFSPAESYYATLFHELGHSTGHASRLARPEVVDAQSFGTDPYSREELVAEMTAAFLCGVAGISPATVENSARYIASWLKVLKSDRKMLVAAASQAQKAADFIRNISDAEGDAEDVGEMEPKSLSESAAVT